MTGACRGLCPACSVISSAVSCPPWHPGSPRAECSPWGCAFPTCVSWVLTDLWGLSSQTADAELPSPPADRSAHHPSRGQLLPHADLHDVQWISLHRCGSRGRDGLFLLQLEEGGCGGHHGALPLMGGAAKKPLCPSALPKRSQHED